MEEKQFRFQDLEIWNRGAAVSGQLFKLADGLEHRHLFRFAAQLRGATLSIANNIAEGSGSVSDSDFANFLNISRRSVFEVANMLILFVRWGYLEEAEIASIVVELAEQSKMILSFRRRLKS